MTEDPTKVSVNTPAGPITVDIAEVLKAHATALQGAERQPSLETRCNENYLGGIKISSVTDYWNYRQGELLFSELDNYIEEEWELEVHTRFVDHGRQETAPDYRNVKTGHDTCKMTAILSTRCIENRISGDRLVLRTSMDCDGDHRIRIFFNDDLVTQATASSFITGFKDYYNAHGPQRGAVFDANLNFLPRNTGATERLVLNPETERLVFRHIFGSFALKDRAAAAGMQTNKGVILSGPPGTGKTLLAKSVYEQEPSLTTIIVSPDMIERGTISRVYDIARRYSPSLVVLEDIDSAGGLSRKIAEHPVLGEVLQALDGISDNAGVFTLASSNHIERLDVAILDRPGRFSRIINIDVHDRTTRRKLLERLAQDYKVSVDLDWLTENTDGVSGDWATELFDTAMKIAWLDNREEASTEDFEEALDDIARNRSQVYTPTSELPVPNGIARSPESSYA
ncbi:MAG: hypothetical protein CMA85_00725 [Euryarchaeota archaeon]|nr:hypothetical protein [Euryarchaeota archaeon]